jgi:hypothetical protein
VKGNTNIITIYGREKKYHNVEGKKLKISKYKMYNIKKHRIQHSQVCIEEWGSSIICVCSSFKGGETERINPTVFLFDEIKKLHAYLLYLLNKLSIQIYIMLCICSKKSYW